MSCCCLRELSSSGAGSCWSCNSQLSQGTPGSRWQQQTPDLQFFIVLWHSSILKQQMPGDDANATFAEDQPRAWILSSKDHSSPADVC